MFLLSTSQHRIIAALQYRNFIVLCYHMFAWSRYHKVVKSFYRGITDGKIAVSQNRKITKSQNRKIAKSLCITYTILRDAICVIAYWWFFKVFQCEFYINACDTMEFAPQFHDLSILLRRKCLIILWVMRCFLRRKIHKPLIDFLNFLLRVPTYLVLLLILNKEGGCWWPQ